jgi:hypothetical protein
MLSHIYIHGVLMQEILYAFSIADIGILGWNTLILDYYNHKPLGSS